ncbi:acyltransferase family protein [Empedobacter falsenii]
MKTEIKSLTGLRGIAALWVVIFHVFYSYVKNYNEVEDTFISDFLFHFTSKGYISVDLFFILSAFVLALTYNKKFSNNIKNETYFDYLKKRLIRIYPLYFIIISISLYFQYNVDFYRIFTHLSLSQAFFNTGLENINMAAWSLSTEFFLYLIFPIIILLMTKFNSKLQIILSSILLVLLYFIQYQDTLYFDLNNQLFLSFSTRNNLDVSIGILAYLRTIITYILGVIFFINWKKIPIINPLLIITFFATSLILKFNDIVIYLTFFILIRSCLERNFLSNLLSSKLAMWLGNISYSIYLNHFLIMFLVSKIPNFPFKEMTINYYLSIVVITLITSHITYVLIEKNAKTFFSKKLIKVYN